MDEVKQIALWVLFVFVAGHLVILWYWHRKLRPMPSIADKAKPDPLEALLTARNEKIARLQADLLYAESLIRRLLAKYEPEDSASRHSAQDCRSNSHIH